MKKLFYRLIASALCLWLLPLEAMATRQLVPVGQVIALELRNQAVSVAAFDETLGSYAQQAGLQIGDEILTIDDQNIHCAEDVRRALEHSDGQITLRIMRNNQQQELCLLPQITTNGPRLGIYLRQGITGIGTVTFYDPDTGRFGSLGHGVNSPKGGLAEMTDGNIYPASVLSVKRGKCGEPGQLKGGVDCPQTLGTLDKNTHCGVFGHAEKAWEGTALDIASRDEIRPGKATIRSTVSGKQTRDYSVEILKVYPENKAEGRNMLIRVTDKDLLAATGGIVQGMSGSPIIQNGKLIGAVTHVLVNDPTTGYGIFIENMLDAAA